MGPHLSNVLVSFVRLALWFVLLALIFIPLERLFSQTRQPILRRDWWADFGLYFLNGLLPPLLLILPMAWLASGFSGLMHWPYYQAMNHLPAALRFLLALVVGDIGGYFGHRWCHINPFLWRIHRVHHSAEAMDWLVNTRANPIDIVVPRLAGVTLIYAVGIAQPVSALGAAVAFYYVFVGTIWSYFVHANIRFRFGFLEQVLASPAFHHWHHANDDSRHLNHNFAALFPWVDRLFGTLLLPSRRWPASYGLLREESAKTVRTC
jgi:sterol desaturase/sphingolipid hydroxylase (fatty acid hydroxylase superfamily)